MHVIIQSNYIILYSVYIYIHTYIYAYTHRHTERMFVSY